MVRGAITRFPPWIVSADEKQRCLQGFDEHIERLKKAVAPEKLLIYNILDGWDPLCHFLELPVPVGMPFPREDSYSVLHWRSDPVTFLSFVYLCYGLYCLCFSAVKSCRKRTSPGPDHWKCNRLHGSEEHHLMSCME